MTTESVVEVVCEETHYSVADDLDQEDERDDCIAQVIVWSDLVKSPGGRVRTEEGPGLDLDATGGYPRSSVIHAKYNKYEG
jgi:hypothetical protein